MPIKRTDQWQLLYMVHSAVQTPMEVYITYEIDFVPESRPRRAGDEAGPAALARRASLGVPGVQRPAQVRRRATASAPGRRRSAPTSTPSARARSARASPATARARDYTLPARGRDASAWTTASPAARSSGSAATCTRAACSNEVDLVRGGEVAADLHRHPDLLGSPTTRTKRGGPPDSWDFSMRVSGLPNWGVHVEPGDMLRSNATYDTTLASTYENMGIVVGAARARGRRRQQAGAGPRPVHRAGRQLRPLRLGRPAGRRRRRCARTACSRRTATTRRTPTAAGPRAMWDVAAAGARRVRPTRSRIADFLYLPGDLIDGSTRSACRRCRSARTCGSPTSTAPAILHTITRASSRASARPGRRSRSPDGETSQGRPVELDSGQLGYSVPGDQRRQERARLDDPGHGRRGLQARRGRDVLLPHPSRRCAARSRSAASSIDTRRLDGRRTLESTTGQKAGRTSGRACPVDVLPCSNDEFLPPPPTPHQHRDHGPARTARSSGCGASSA